MLKHLTLAATLFLSACMMVGPDYKDPKAKISQHWMGAKKNKHASVRDVPVKTAEWWKQFHDPTLSKVIKIGYCNNLDLQMAGVRVLQYRAILAQSVGELYPQTQALVGDYNYQRIGGNVLKGLIPNNFLSASVGFTANWEIDFWGKYRRAIQSHDAAFLASIASYDNALVTLIADIARTYINIRTYEEIIRVTKANIELQTESQRIAKARYGAGQTSALDVEQATTSLEQTKATLPEKINTLHLQKYRLAVLLGMTPNEIDKVLVKSYGIPRAPSQIEVGIPRDTLFQRPDIHQARLEAMSEAAGIGAIKAELFPAFSLGGNFSFSTTNIRNNSISNLFDWSNRTATVGPSVTWPLLNYGQITNAVRAQDAVYQQSILNYLNKVLKAEEEVQGNISSYVQEKDAVYSYARANRSAMETVNLSLVRYKEGETNYTTVLQSERDQLQIQIALTFKKGSTSQAIVDLYRSFGGGWQIRKHRDIVPYRIREEMGTRTNWGNLLATENHLKPATKWQAVKQFYLPSW